MARPVQSVVGALAVGVLAVGVLAGALAGCGAAAAHPHSPTPSAGAGTTAASARCTAADVSARLVPGSPGAGQRYAYLVLTNTSGHDCLVRGFGGMQLYAADGRQVPTHLHRAAAPAPTDVVLAHGESASSMLHWTVVPSGDEPARGPCEPEATSAQVTPPDETHSLTVPWRLGVVCGHGSIEQRAYAAGLATG
jgi:hypothetical protein